MPFDITSYTHREKSQPSMAAQAAFVTGSTGFVALNLVDRLLADGYTVYALHRSGSTRAAYLRDLPHAGEKLVVVQGDLCDSNFAALVPADVTVIFHIAHLAEDSRNLHSGRVGITAPGFTPEGAAEHRRLNLAAMRNVLAAAANVRRVVYCSSWSSYGVLPAGTAVDESTPSTAFDCTVPTGLCGGGRVFVPYFASKLECEELLRAELEAGRVREGVILQPCSVFGRYGEAGWCQIFGKLLQSGGRMPGLPGSSSFCDVQDLAAAFVAAATAGPGRCERYVIGGTNASSLEMQSIHGGACRGRRA